MLLAGILALWMLSAVPCSGSANSSSVPVALRGTGPSTPQAPASQTPPSSQSQNSQTAPESQQPPKSPSGTSTAPTKKKKKKATAPAPGDPNSPAPKKVVSHGSTEEPTTHLGPSITDEQTAKTRAANTDLVNQAEGNLQKLNGRQLTPEQQQTADQVRKFVEQAKAADQEGDLQRATSLANKAKLLSESLEQTSRPK